MRKTVLVLAVAAVSLFAKGNVVPPDPGSGDGTVEIVVDGESVDTYGLAVSDGDMVTVPLRSVAEALGATSVTWDDDGCCAYAAAPGLTIWVPFYEEYIEANGRCWYVPGGVDLADGRCLVPLDFLAWAFGAEAEADGPGRVALTTTDEPLAEADEFYPGEDLYWLSRIIQAEAGAEPFSGKIAVGNVVLNRTVDDEFPDTVKEVIFDRRFGIQFTPAYSGSINNTPSSGSVAAAKLALEGVETADGALYFSPRRSAGTCWASRHFDVVAEISGHVFFG